MRLNMVAGNQKSKTGFWTIKNINQILNTIKERRFPIPFLYCSLGSLYHAPLLQNCHLTRNSKIISIIRAYTANSRLYSFSLVCY